VLVFSLVLVGASYGADPRAEGDAARQHGGHGSGEQVWTVPADGSGARKAFLSQADSPAVVR